MLTNSNPPVSVVIPTHNRSSLLRRLLEALAAQTYPADRLEVVVVADGCVDDTWDTLSGHVSSFALKAVTQPNRGQAEARNRGAREANGALLLFIDDDMEPTAGWVEAHVRAHQRWGVQVVIGPCPPVIREPRPGLLRIQLRTWWESIYRDLSQPGHRYTFRDLLSGNLSLSRELFEHAGGFDSSLRYCHEDWELGVRLLKLGARFAFAPDAVGYHHDTCDLNRSLRRAYHEGRANVHIVRRHPEMISALPITGIDLPRPPVGRMMRGLAFASPVLGSLLASYLSRMMTFLERIRYRSRWQSICDGLFLYWFWRGVAEELGTPEAVRAFLESSLARGCIDELEMEVDLEEGLEEAERLLDDHNPSSIVIRYGDQPVGRIAPRPGTERLRGAHLRPILAADLMYSLLGAMAMQTALQQEGSVPLSATQSAVTKETARAVQSS